MEITEKSTEIIDAKISFMSIVDRPANRRKFLLTKGEGGKQAEFAIEGRILQKYEATPGETHFITGVAYEPNVADTDDEFMTPEEIEKAAHWFMKNGRRVDEQHSFESNPGCQIVESWIATDDTEIGGQAVTKGTWLVKVEITDADVWQKVTDGSYTGFSIGGMCRYGEDVDLTENEGVEKMDTENITTEKSEEKENRSLLAKFARFLGLTTDADSIEKGAVADDYEKQMKYNGFWEAWYALDNNLRQWDWHDDTYHFEGDPDKVAEALQDFCNIVTDLLVEKPDEIITALGADAAVAKAGKKISAERLKTLLTAQEAINTLVADVSEPAPAEEDTAAETDATNGENADGEGSEGAAAVKSEKEESAMIMSAEERAELIAEIVKAVKESDAPAQTTAPDPAPAPETFTKAEVEAMIEEAVSKAAAQNEEPADAPAAEEPAAEETMTKAEAESFIAAKVAELAKAHGLSKAQNEEVAEPANKGGLFDSLFM